MREMFAFKATACIKTVEFILFLCIHIVKAPSKLQCIVMVSDENTKILILLKLNSLLYNCGQSIYDRVENMAFLVIGCSL